ncbi:hypothetical protein EV122DRAFT_273878 [Schizophyllum commune]
MACNPTRLRALRLYKELLYLGKEYPDPAYDFKGKIRRMFESKMACLEEGTSWTEKATENRNLTDHEDIEKALKMAEYIKNETLALYSLRKYRHLKNHYYPDS